MTEPTTQREKPEPNPLVLPTAGFGGIGLVAGVIVLLVGLANADGGATIFGQTLATVGGAVLGSGIVIGGFDWSLRHRGR